METNYSHNLQCLFYLTYNSYIYKKQLYLPEYLINNDNFFFTFLKKKYNFDIIKRHQLLLSNSLFNEIGDFSTIRDNNINKIQNEQFKFSFNQFFKSEHTYKCIYVTRQKSSRRHIVNEYELITSLKNNISELEVISLDYGYSYLDQAKMFSSCKLFISLHGAAIINMIYMPKNSKVIEITPPIKHNYPEIAKICEINHYYACCENYRPSDNCIRYPRDCFITLSTEEIENVIKIVNDC